MVELTNPSSIYLETVSGRRLQKICCHQDGVNLWFSTDVIYFAHKPVGEMTDWQPLIIQNNGSVAVGLATFVIEGDFNYDAAPLSLAPGASTMVKVRFNPTADGLRLGTLKITTDIPGLTHSVKLVGVGGDEVTVSAFNLLLARMGEAEGMILNEASIRVTADTAMAQVIGYIGAKTPDGSAFILDMSKVYVSPNESFATRLETISSTLGENTAAITNERTARTTKELATAQSIETLTVNVGAAHAAISNEQTLRAQGDAANAEVIETISVRVDDTESAITSESEARVNGDEAIAEVISLIGSQSADYSAFILNTSTTRVTPTMTMAEKFEEIMVTAGDNASALIQEESEARASADGALASRITTIETSYVTTAGANNIANTVATAKVADEALTRSNADQALSTRITTIEATYLTIAAGQATTIAAAKVAEEADARADADEAMADRITTIEASYVTAADVTGIATTVANAKVADEVLVRAAADQALAARATAIESSIGDPNTGLGNAHARITTESQARTTAINTAIGDEVTARNQAIASSVQVVQTAVDGNIATVTEHASSINGLKTRYGVALDNNGHVTGFVQNNDGTTGTFDVVVDKFRVAMPGANPIQIFSVTSDGVRINGNLIVNGSVYSNQLGNGAMGEAAMSYDETNLAVNTQGTFSNVSSVTIQSKHGKPMKIDFTTFARCTNDNSTRLRLRVVRNDGFVIYGGVYGSEVRINDEGTPICIRAVSDSVAETTYTFTLQAVKSVNNETVNFGFRMAYVEEMSRVNWQSVTINNAPSGSDPGSGGYTGGTGGDGGGGGVPDPGGYEPRDFDEPLP